MARRLAQQLVAELVGTFLFFFVGMGAYVAGFSGQLGAGLNLVAALAHGLALAVLATALGSVSGAHFNPAVTFGAWIAGRIDVLTAVLYAVAQIVGGVAAAAVLRFAVFPDSIWVQSSLGLPVLTSYLSTGGGIIVEAILTSIWMLVVLGTSIDPRARRVGGMAVGLAVAAGMLMGGTLTGAAMNPARWFAPALASQTFDNWSVWVLGPLAGAALAAVLFRFVLASAVDLSRSPGQPEGAE